MRKHPNKLIKDNKKIKKKRDIEAWKMKKKSFFKKKRVNGKKSNLNRK